MDENTTPAEVVDETVEVSKMDKVKAFGRKYWKHTAVGVAAVAGAAITVAAFWNSDSDDETESVDGELFELDAPEVDVEIDTTDDTPTE